ncbi:mucin-3B-like, partial [Equus quagga]|uniref:mucin-3B-like n=1 Tax=Equus quagga TaxID=89248 RepID=UPI001EE1B262
MSGPIVNFPFFSCCPGTCENDGTWIQDHCLCRPGFSGDRCERQDSVCENEGQWDGLKCVCPSTFYGTHCEFAVEQMDFANCTSDVEGAINCNQGQCFVQKTGPECRCFSTDTLWFLGPRCEVAVQWRALVGGLAGAGALLLLLLLALTFFVRRWRRSGRGGARSWDYDKKWFEIWDEDTAGTFSNSGFQDDQPFKDENFQVALEMVNTNVRVRGQRGD